jgi:hypothetical protein
MADLTVVGGNIRVRRGSLADFQAANRVYAAGEPLHVIDAQHNDWLTGDGARDFNALWSDANSIPNRAKAAADAAAASAAQAATMADPGYDVWLLAGQSNTSGRAADFDSARIDVSDPRYWQYAASGPYANRISLAVEPLGFPDSTTGMGIANAFAQKYLASVPVSRKLLVVPAAYGGTGFIVPDTNGGQRTWLTSAANDGNNLYENAIQQTLAALAAAGPKARLAGILWLQGETDALNGSSGAPAAYAGRLDALIDGFRSRFGIADLPFILGQMRADVIANGSTFQTVNAVHIDTPRRKVRTAFAYGPVGAAFYNNDTLHYNAAGERFNGAAMFNVVATALANNVGTAPSAPLSVSVSQAGTAVRATWARPVGRATDYNVQFSTNAGTSWTDVTRSASIDNSATLGALPVGTSVTTRVRTVNETGTSGWATSPSYTVVTPPVVAALLLSDVTASPWRAYSVSRRLRSAYTGPLLRVRRSTDGTEQDIAASSDVLDVASLKAFVGSADGFVKTVYDQSGGGVNITQAVAAAQPQIVSNGTVLAVNSHPAMKFNGTSNYFTDAAIGLYAAGAATISEVGALNAAGTSRFVTETKNIPGATGLYYQPMGSNATTAYSVIFGDGGGVALSAAGAVLFDGNPHVGMVLDSGSAVSSYQDGSLTSPTAYTRPTTTAVMENFNVGARVQGTGGSTIDSFVNGLVAELVVWKSSLSTSDAAAARANQKAFYGTP